MSQNEITNILVDAKVDLSAQEISIDYASKFADTLITSTTPKQSTVQCKLSENLTRQFKVYGLESELDINENSITSRIICHDESYKLKFAWYRCLYLYNSLKNSDGSMHTPSDELGNRIPYKVNSTIRASQVLKDALETNDIALNVNWQVIDYNVVNKRHKSEMYDTSVDGLIQQLIQPLNFTTKNPAIVYIDENTIYIRKQSEFLESGTIVNKNKQSNIETFNISNLRLNSISIRKSIEFKPPIGEVMVEYYKYSTIDTSSIEGDPTTETTYDAEGNIKLQVIRIVTTKCGVVIKEEEQQYMDALYANIGKPTEISSLSGSILKSISITEYEYDIDPDDLDENGCFQNYRNLLKKTIETTIYGWLIWTGKYAGLSHWDETEKLSSIVLNEYTITSKELIQESEDTTKLTATTKPDEYGITWTSSEEKVITTHIQLSHSIVETSQKKYTDNTYTGSFTTIRQGKLQSSSQTPENDSSNQNWEKKYISVKSAGIYNIGEPVDYPINYRVEKLSSEYLNLSQLKNVAYDILSDNSYIKISIDMSILPLTWVKKGNMVNLIGVIPMTIIDETGKKFVEDVNFSNLTDTPLLVESLNYSSNGESVTGSMNLVGYRYV